MKNRIVKPISVILCALLAVGGTVAAAAYSSNAGKTDNTAAEDKVSLIDHGDENENTKDETVYVIAGADGAVKKIIVSDWLKNTLGEAQISDKSEMGDVENVHGDESYTMGGDGTRVWDAAGGDIYYQGNIEKELPVGMSVSYKLDGSSISTDELAGKSGHVTIRYDYTNNQYETVEIDGKEEKIYVPFAMLTGMLLDNDVFTNVEVTNGKIVNDGNHTVVVGIAFPGLSDNLAIDESKLEIPSYVEIEADVKNFEMTNTISIATNDIFSKMNSDNFDAADELTGSLDELTDAMSQLMDGSSQLYDGLCTLLDKSGELVSGIDKLAAGAEALKNGAAQLRDGSAALADGASELNGGAAQLRDGSATLSDGANTLSNGAAALDSGVGQIAAGAAQLAGGLGELCANNDTLNGGAAQVFASLLTLANNQIKEAGIDAPELTIENYKTVLDGIIASLDTASVTAKAEAVARETVTAKVNENMPQIEAGVTAVVKDQVKPQVEAGVRSGVEKEVLASQGMTKEQYDAAVAAGAISAEVQAQINAAIDAQMQTEAVQALIEQNLAAQMASDKVKALIAENTAAQAAALIEQNMKSDEVQSQINAAVEKASAGAASLTALKAQLSSYNEFYDGLRKYTAGVESANAGAGTLSSGAAELKNGSSTLAGGAAELAGGAADLKNGAATLADGASSLSDGAAQVNSGAASLSDGAAELYNGVLTMKNGAPALVDGITALRDGSLKLSDGLREFNDKGVQKLVDAVNGDLAGLVTRMRATVDVSKDYKSFTGISDDMNGEVKFIYRTDSVTAPSED